jgi:hypothetical protein
MKFIKFASDVSLGISIILFSYIYWFSYQIEQHGSLGMSVDEITDVTVSLFTVALAISLVSAILRYVEIRTTKISSLLSKALLVISLLPAVRVVIGYVFYWIN